MMTVIDFEQCDVVRGGDDEDHCFAQGLFQI